MTTLVSAPAAVVEGARPHGRFVRHSVFLTVRSLRTLLRQPSYAIATLVQPVVWLLLFGALFKSVVTIPGFGPASQSYLEFITPGVIVMTALFSSGWAGTVYIEDMKRGVMDRFLASPVSRGAMMLGTLAYQAITTVVQTLVVFGIAWVAGARFTWAGIGVTLAAAVLISVIIASLSNALALLLRQQEALIGISQFIVLPLQFLSSALMSVALAAAWVRHVATVNPVDWAVVAARQSLLSGTDWSVVASRLGWLGIVALVMAYLATRAFGAYQRSL